jgi:hypothetical protein
MGRSDFLPGEPGGTQRAALVLCAWAMGVALLPAAGCKSSSSTPPGTVAVQASAPPGTVALQGSASKPTYTSAEHVVANLVITNGTDAGVGLSPNVSGTLTVVSLTRDGVAVATRETVSNNDESLALRTVEYNPNGGANRAVYYFVGRPGQYVLKVRYALPADAARPGEAIQNPGDPTTINFAVSP